MVLSSLVLLHGATGAEVGPSTYVARVLLHLLALAGAGALAYLAASLPGAVRDALSSG